MRYSTDLCKEEKKFIQKRKEFVFEAMRTFLGDRGPQTIEEVSEKIEIGLMNISITMTGLKLNERISKHNAYHRIMLLCVGWQQYE